MPAIECWRCYTTVENDRAFFRFYHPITRDSFEAGPIPAIACRDWNHTRLHAAANALLEGALRAAGYDVLPGDRVMELI
jgi:hypothetical protein